MRFELPLPPTANNAYPTNWKTKRRYLSPRAKAWKVEAGWLIAKSNPEKIVGPYHFQIFIPEKARGDDDGYIKIPKDLLVELGLTPDDRRSVSSCSVRCSEVSPGRCVVDARAA
jgi:Holliday junction resolvase RusA-like endonuclease